MASQGLHPDVKVSTSGMVLVAGSFATNGSTSVATSTFRGNCISSVTWSATGAYNVVLNKGLGFRYVLAGDAQLAESAAAPDGSYATLCPPTPEGSNAALTFKIVTFTCAGGAAPLDFTTRRVSFYLWCKNSLAGS